MDRDEAKSVTHWIRDLGTSKHDEATRLLCERYFAKVARMSQVWLRDVSRGHSDGEDVALSVFDTFFRAAMAGQFPRLENREDLWRLLMTIAARKAHNIRRDELRQKRGGGLIARQLDNHDEYDILAQVACEEPTPELTAIMADETRRLFACLGDESLQTIVRLKMEGHSNADIAKSLDCGLRTVERKLEVIRKRWLAEGGA